MATGKCLTCSKLNRASMMAAFGGGDETARNFTRIHKNITEIENGFSLLYNTLFPMLEILFFSGKTKLAVAKLTRPQEFSS